jgi:hypothetical protein
VSSEWSAITFGDDVRTLRSLTVRSVTVVLSFPGRVTVFSRYSHAEAGAVLVFNTALTFHREGLESGRSRSLLKALLLKGPSESLSILCSRTTRHWRSSWLTQQWRRFMLTSTIRMAYSGLVSCFTVSLTGSDHPHG